MSGTPKSKSSEEDEDIFKDPFEALYELGLAIFTDDAPDFPEVISTWGKEPGKHGVLKGSTIPWLPPHIHHWVAGVVIMAGSAVGKVLYGLECGRQINEAVQKEAPAPLQLQP
jgi:hypothetical protein